jgi:Co/Zn/Cd efflux system component
MHIHPLEKLQHDHDFVVIHKQGERRTRQVFVLTSITMLAEIGAGHVFGSMALLADG